MGQKSQKLLAPNSVPTKHIDWWLYTCTYLFALSGSRSCLLALVCTPQLLLVVVAPFPHSCSSMHALPPSLILLLLAAPWPSLPLSLLLACVHAPSHRQRLAYACLSSACDILSVKSIISILTLSNLGLPLYLRFNILVKQMKG